MKFRWSVVFDFQAVFRRSVPLMFFEVEGGMLLSLIGNPPITADLGKDRSGGDCLAQTVSVNDRLLWKFKWGWEREPAINQ